MAADGEGDTPGLKPKTKADAGKEGGLAVPDDSGSAPAVDSTASGPDDTGADDTDPADTGADDTGDPDPDTGAADPPDTDPGPPPPDPGDAGDPGGSCTTDGECGAPFDCCDTTVGACGFKVFGTCIAL